jgi:hypothetical protein
MIVGVATEISYALGIILAGFFVSLILSFKI